MSTRAPAPFHDIQDASFEREVLRHPKPCVVILWTPWSQGYAIMEETLKQVAAAHAEHVRTVRVDLDQSVMMATHFHVRALPMIMLVDAGQIVERREGVLDRATLTELYDSVTPETGQAPSP